MQGRREGWRRSHFDREGRLRGDHKATRPETPGRRVRGAGDVSFSGFPGITGLSRRVRHPLCLTTERRPPRRRGRVTGH